MQEKVVEFANLLRENGVRVSLAETLDAFSASQVTGLAERDAFRAALRSTMVKRSTELPVFEELFDIYFSGLGEIIKQASSAVQNALSMSDQEFQKFLDEIDKADAEFEAFLLELLSDFQVTVPELGTLKAKHIPLVVLTSNNAREMSDALKRRCLHLYIDFPDRAQELAIVKLKVPEAANKLMEEVVTVVQSLRKLDLKKTPGISETLDWVKALTLLNVQSLDQELVNETLDTIVKYEGDIRKAQEELKDYVRRVRARRGTEAGSDKDLLN